MSPMRLLLLLIAASLSTLSATTTPSPTPALSPKSECGAAGTQAICGWAQPCCNKDGLCGSSDEFCSPGCQPAFSFRDSCSVIETEPPTLMPTPALAVRCMSGWTEFNDFCWRITQAPFTWASCEEACAPGWPACISNTDENLFLADLAYEQQKPTIWLGATDQEEEGVWKWTPSCPHASNFTAWSPNEPNNFGKGGDQNCATQWSSFYGGWDDKSCTAVTAPCACQMPAYDTNLTAECGPGVEAVCGWGQPCCSHEGFCGSSDAFCNDECLAPYSFRSTCSSDEATESPTITPAPTTTPEPTPFTNCPSGWVEYHDQCWRITTVSYRSTECDAACAPGRPACIFDEAENLFLAELAYEEEVAAVWLSLSEVTEGVWEWAASCPHKSTFRAWSPNEPNNMGFGGEQNCAALWSDFYGGWDDKSCSKIKTPCACQLPATNSSFTPECGTDTGAVCGWSQPCCREDGLCGSSDEFCNADCLSSFSFQSACGTDETAAPTVTPAPTIASECPSGWREYQGYCWNITTESYPWNQCDEACAPGWPACILDEDVNLWLADLAFTQRVSAAWIGATDAATEGVWEWTASCPYVSTFTAWSPNEPNNVGIGGEQDCAVIWSLFYGGWDDKSCTAIDTPCICQTWIPQTTPSPTDAGDSFSTTYYVNPRDARLTSITADSSEEATTFFGRRDLNGLPTAVYAVQHSVTKNDDLLAMWDASVVTTFETDETGSRVDRTVVKGVTFDLLYDNGTVSVQVESQLGTFSFTSPAVDARALLIEKPPALESVPFHDLSPYLNATAVGVSTSLADADGQPLPAEDVVFLAETGSSTSLLAAEYSGGGVYVASVPFYPAPTDVDSWLDLVLDGTERQTNYACDLLDAAYNALADVVCSATLSVLGSETSPEAQHVIEVCPTVFQSWERSCVVVTGSASEKDVDIVDAATPESTTITPIGRILNDPTSETRVTGSTIEIPAATVDKSGKFVQKIPSVTVPTLTPTTIGACNDFTNAGGDTPEVAKIELGTRTGTFEFTFETFSIKDKIDITHGGHLIFSTGCVGENDKVSVSLSPESSATSIIVDVSPNCAGTSNTEWNYVVSCPSGEAVMECGSEVCVCKATDGAACAVRDPKPSRARASNGCGEKDGTSYNGILPDDFKDDFIAACDAHDICYGTCGVSRSVCDLIFSNSLQSSCSSPFDLACQAYAKAFYLGVRFFGAGAYEHGQMEYCDCGNC